MGLYITSFLKLQSGNDESYRRPGPSRREEEGVKGPGPVNNLCHKILLLLYISAVHFYSNSSVLKGYLKEPSTLMTFLMSETKSSY